MNANRTTLSSSLARLGNRTRSSRKYRVFHTRIGSYFVRAALPAIVMAGYIGNVQAVTVTSNSARGVANVDVTATCPVGNEAVGGGGAILPSSSGNPWTLLYSGPDSTTLPTGWRVTYICNDSSQSCTNAQATVKAYAMCNLLGL